MNYKFRLKKKKNKQVSIATHSPRSSYKRLTGKGGQIKLYLLTIIKYTATSDHKLQ